MFAVVLSIIGSIFLLCVLILIHEWGHFIAAKKLGVTVEEFGFGLPPRAKTLFTKSGTKFTLNWIPFGGFVRLKGENALEEKAYTAPGSFAAAPIPARVVILCAGVFMNFLLAVVVLATGFMAGWWMPTYDTCEDRFAASQAGLFTMESYVYVDSLVAGEGAAIAGLPEQTYISAVDGQRVACPGQIAALQEGKNTVEYAVLPEPGGEVTLYSVPLTDGKAGVVLMPIVISYDMPMQAPWTAFGYAFREAWMITKQTTIAIVGLFASVIRSLTIPEGVAGIVGIAQLTYISVQEGFAHYLRLMAILSLSLAALNILPFPALDGGRLLFVLAELVARRRINRQVELITNAVGFVFLISLILFITYNDITRLVFP